MYFNINNIILDSKFFSNNMIILKELKNNDYEFQVPGIIKTILHQQYIINMDINYRT